MYVDEKDVYGMLKVALFDILNFFLSYLFAIISYVNILLLLSYIV